ncbi:hypothetical protein [Streptomyces sp. NBC_01538]|uniref:hypothetical protein n=1 Tax=Streptomyces sp. NBC_01538 TaxID=2903897 RepID=UPI00386871DE
METASYLEIPQSTFTSWLKNKAAGSPLVHQVEPVRKGQPSVPFIAVAEAHVLRSLRYLGLRMSEIKEAAAAVRDAFDTPYGLVSQRIATDGVDIFIEHGWGDLRIARRQWGAGVARRGGRGAAGAGVAGGAAA